jgi:hypothetical protein
MILFNLDFVIESIVISTVRACMSQARSLSENQDMPRSERRVVRCKAVRRRRCWDIGEERQRSRCPRATGAGIAGIPNGIRSKNQQIFPIDSFMQSEIRNGRAAEPSALQLLYALHDG